MFKDMFCHENINISKLVAFAEKTTQQEQFYMHLWKPADDI